MKLNSLVIIAAAFAGFASTADAYATSGPFSASDAASASHNQLRHILVGERKLDAGISLPSGVVRSSVGVAAVLCFTPTGDDGNANVAFYDIKTGGWSLDDKRQTRAGHPSGSCSNELQG